VNNNNLRKNVYTVRGDFNTILFTKRLSHNNKRAMPLLLLFNNSFDTFFIKKQSYHCPDYLSQLVCIINTKNFQNFYINFTNDNYICQAVFL